MLLRSHERRAISTAPPPPGWGYLRPRTGGAPLEVAQDAQGKSHQARIVGVTREIHLDVMRTFFKILNHPNFGMPAISVAYNGAATGVGNADQITVTAGEFSSH